MVKSQGPNTAQSTVPARPALESYGVVPRHLSPSGATPSLKARECVTRGSAFAWTPQATNFSPTRDASARFMAQPLGAWLEFNIIGSYPTRHQQEGRSILDTRRPPNIRQVREACKRKWRVWEECRDSGASVVEKTRVNERKTPARRLRGRPELLANRGGEAASS